jgi:hypothetical protein
MFWNDPNLYSVAFKDVPNLPAPFFGGMPRFANPYPMTPFYFTPPVTPQLFAPPIHPNYFTPPVTPQLFAPPIHPNYFTPPVTPYMQTPVTPFVNPMIAPFNYTHPFFQGYRPFGL